MHFSTTKTAPALEKTTEKNASAQLNDTVIKKPTSRKILEKKEKTDFDTFANATSGDCSLVLLMRHYNVQPQPELELLSHEETGK